jgi:cytochrome P450 PksS
LTCEVFQVRFLIVGKVWTTTTGDLIDRVLNDSETCALRENDGSRVGFPWWIEGILPTRADKC